MHIKKNNYDILNFQIDHQDTGTTRPPPVSSLSSDLHSPSAGQPDLHRQVNPKPGFFKSLFQAIRGTMRR